MSWGGIHELGYYSFEISEGILGVGVAGHERHMIGLARRLLGLANSFDRFTHVRSILADMGGLMVSIHQE